MCKCEEGKGTINTETKPYSISSLIDQPLTTEVKELIHYRQDSFTKSYDYKIADNEFNELLEKMQTVLPTDLKEKTGKIKDLVVRIECMLYEKAYMDGMVDIMGALALDQAEIINAKYLIPKGRML